MEAELMIAFLITFFALLIAEGWLVHEKMKLLRRIICERDVKSGLSAFMKALIQSRSFPLQA